MNLKQRTIFITASVLLAVNTCLPAASTAVPADARARTDRNIGVLKDTLSPSGTLLATGGATDVTIWDARTFQLLRTLKGHTEEVRDVAWSRDSSRLVSGGHDNNVLLWDVTSETPPIKLGSHPTYVYSVALSSDDRFAASEATLRRLAPGATFSFSSSRLARRSSTVEWNDSIEPVGRSSTSSTKAS